MSPAIVRCPAELPPNPPPTCFYALPFKKVQEIALWRMEVDRCRTPSCGSLTADPLIDLTDEFVSANCRPEVQMMFHQLREEGEQALEVDKLSYTAEGDKRVYDLPHPDCNPLTCGDKEMIEMEYVRVLRVWNDFEEEKWAAEKQFHKMPTPENLQRLIVSDMAVQSAGAAARYIELHGTRYQLSINFDAFFFKYYRPPLFYLHLQDDSWDSITPGFDDSIPQWDYQPTHYQQPHYQQPYTPQHQPAYHSIPPQWPLYTPQMQSHPIQV